jgi:deoxyribonuclease-4
MSASPSSDESRCLEAPSCERGAELRPIGAHVPGAGGLATAGLRYAAAVGAGAVQVFVSNPRAWAPTPGDGAQEAALLEHVTRTGLPLFVHAPYLINPASPDQVLRERSAQSLRHSLRRGRRIGARGVVVHTGSAIDGDPAAALARVRQTLLPLLDELGDDDPDLLLEPMAGQGQMLCCGIADLGPYLDALSWHPRAHVCLDLCHVFAAGHDLTAGDGADRMLAEFAATAGGRLRLIHANDSKDGCGSLRDRHEAIGHGQIPAAAFARLLAHPATAGIPFIVETPGGERGQAADIAALRQLRDAGQPGPTAAYSGGPSPSSS